jgi:hypothetical protein
MSDEDHNHADVPFDVVRAAQAGFGRRTGRKLPVGSGGPLRTRSAAASPPSTVLAEEATPHTLPSPARLALSYAKACIAAFLVLFLLNTGLSVFGQAVEVSPMRLLVAALFAWVFGIPLLPVVMAAVVVVRLLRVPRGYADVLVGALVGAVILAWQARVMGTVTTWALKLFVAATFGGLAFWRSEGFPGAAPRARNELGASEQGLKRGLWLGARLWR